MACEYDGVPATARRKQAGPPKLPGSRANACNRHEHASLLLGAGSTIERVQELLGLVVRADRRGPRTPRREREAAG